MQDMIFCCGKARINTVLFGSVKVTEKKKKCEKLSQPGGA